MRKVSASYLPREKLTPIFLLLPCLQQCFSLSTSQRAETTISGVKEHTHTLCTVTGWSLQIWHASVTWLPAGGVRERWWNTPQPSLSHATLALLNCRKSRDRSISKIMGKMSNCAKNSVPDSIRYCFEDVLSFQWFTEWNGWIYFFLLFLNCSVGTCLGPA